VAQQAEAFEADCIRDFQDVGREPLHRVGTAVGRLVAGSVAAVIEDSARLRARLSLTRGFVTISGREAIAAVRETRGHSSAKLWPLARRWAAIIDSLPFVRMVAVTGALAVDNAPAGDDIDYLIVTAPGRVWLARALAVGVVRVASVLGVGLCPNYVLAHSALSQQKRNLFIAHDLARLARCAPSLSCAWPIGAWLSNAPASGCWAGGWARRWSVGNATASCANLLRCQARPVPRRNWTPSG